MQDQAMLTIILPTFNKKDYIAQTLDSIFMQKTTYSYQVIIADDASSDGTLDIVREYNLKYPNAIQNPDSKTHKSLNQLTLFFCIGGGITLLELLGFYILYKIFGVHYILASLIMFMLASGIGVWLYRRFAFGEIHLHSSLEIGLTYLINTIGIGLNTLILWLCVEFLGFEAIVAKILASLLVAFYGFYARKLVIYKKDGR